MAGDKQVEAFNDKERNPKQSTQRSQYPRQWILKTPGGVTMLVGNERGKEHIIISHPSGSHVEYHPDGTVTSHNNAEKVDYTKGGVTISVDENNDVKVTGHNKMQVSGGGHIEVAGDAGIVVAGDVMLGGMKNFAMSAKNVYLGARGNFNIASSGDFKIDSKGKSTVISDGDMTLGTKGNMARAADGSVSDKGSSVRHNSSGDQTGSGTVNGNRDSGGGTGGGGEFVGV